MAASWIFDNPDKTLPDCPITETEIESLAGKIYFLNLVWSFYYNFLPIAGSLLQSDLDTHEGEDDEELPEGYDGPYKMVFVVNMELGMGIGKIAAQVSLNY